MKRTAIRLLLCIAACCTIGITACCCISPWIHSGGLLPGRAEHGQPLSVRHHLSGSALVDAERE